MEINEKVTKLLLSIVGAILTGFLGLLFFLIKKQYDVADQNQKFYEEWKADEETEELQMLTPHEKVKVLHHLDTAPSESEITEIRIDQKYIKEQTKRNAKMDTLNADQLYQIKEELKKIRNN